MVALTLLGNDGLEDKFMIGAIQDKHGGHHIHRIARAPTGCALPALSEVGLQRFDLPIEFIR